MENQTYNEFSMRELFFFLKKKVWIVVVLAIIGTVGGYIWGRTMVIPTYVTDSQIYVYDSSASMEYSELQIATQLRRDVEILICGKKVTGEVIERLGLNMSPAAMSARIAVDSVENTRVLKVTYVDTNPRRAAVVLNTICEVGRQQIEDTLKVDAVSVLYEAEVPTAPTTQGARHYALIGGIGGLALGIALLVVFFLIDDTIHNEEDVERYLDLPTLAAIPLSRELGDGTQRTIGKRLVGGLKGRKKR